MVVVRIQGQYLTSVPSPVPAVAATTVPVLSHTFHIPALAHVILFL